MFRLLGPLDLEIEDRHVDLGSPKQRAVLAALLLDAGSAVSVDQLVAAVWGDAAPRTARHSVQLYIGVLRRLLEEAGVDARIETSRRGYLLDLGDSELDLDVFERTAMAGIEEVESGDLATGVGHLDESMALWREPPLQDFSYDEFSQPAIRHLERVYHDAVLARADGLIALDRPREALAIALPVFEADPLDEHAARAVMVAASGLGSRVEALRHYEAHRRALTEQLGLSPGPAVEEMFEAILRDAPTLGQRDAGRVRRNPYKGLRAFGEADADDFYGRTQEVSELVRRVSWGDGFVALVGPSGCGKSSIVHAGLVPALRRGEGRSRDVLVAVPGRHPLADPALASASTGTPGERVLVIDQFEELYTLTGAEERDHFVDRVLGLLRSGVSIVVVLRADFFDRVLADRRLARLFSRGSLDVLPLNAARLGDAARLPARSAGLELQEELLAELVAATADRQGSLPLFEFVLTELVERAEGSLLTLDSYRSLGGVEGTLVRQAERLYESLSVAEREGLRQILLRLATAGQEAPSRRRDPLSELSALELDAAVFDRVLDELGRARLVTFGRDPGGAPTVEVAHEALFAEWGRLARWIDEARSDLARRRALQTAIEEWRRADCAPDYLPSGGRLEDLERWLSGTTIALSGEERGFLEQARDHEDQRLAGMSAAEAARTRLVRRARHRLWAAIAGGTFAAAIGAFALLSWATAPDPPDVAVLVLEEDASGVGAFSQLIHQGAADAAERFGLDVEMVSVNAITAPAKVRELAAGGVAVVVHAYAGTLAGVNEADMLPPGPTHVALDVAFEDPTVASYTFAEQEGSFLVGVAAASTTQTHRVGFVGGMDVPLIHRFQAGYEVGVAAVDPSVTVTSVYLAPCPDFSGFGSPALGVLGATALFDEDVDVVYHAAGDSGYGVILAAERVSTETGLWRWVIGVDRDQYADLDASAAGGWVPRSAGVDPATLQSHVLTSMVKRFDVAIVRAVGDWATGRIHAGTTVSGLGDGSMDYATSGGFIDGLVPELEGWRRRIVSGEVAVPSSTPGTEDWDCVSGPTGLRGTLAP